MRSEACFDNAGKQTTAKGLATGYFFGGRKAGSARIEQRRLAVGDVGVTLDDRAAGVGQGGDAVLLVAVEPCFWFLPTFAQRRTRTETRAGSAVTTARFGDGDHPNHCRGWALLLPILFRRLRIFRARVRLVMGFTQTLDRRMCVDLRRAEVFMTEQCFDFRQLEITRVQPGLFPGHSQLLGPIAFQPVRFDQRLATRRRVELVARCRSSSSGLADGDRFLAPPQERRAADQAVFEKQCARGGVQILMLREQESEQGKLAGR